MLKIGLTGGIGSGKSTAACFFSDLDIEVIDLDQIAREVVKPGTSGLEALRSHFGESILNHASELDRAALGAIVFNNPEEKKWLEALLHPLIREKQHQRIAAAISAYVVIEIPLLTENNLSNSVDRVLVIDSPEELQILRAETRGRQSREQIQKTMSSQASRMERQAIADDIVLNDGSEQQLKTEILKLHKQYLELAGQHT